MVLSKSYEPHISQQIYDVCQQIAANRTPYNKFAANRTFRNKFTAKCINCTNYTNYTNCINYNHINRNYITIKLLYIPSSWHFFRWAMTFYLNTTWVFIRIFFFGLVVAVCGKPPRTVRSRRACMVLSDSYEPRISQQICGVCQQIAANRMFCTFCNKSAANRTFRNKLHISQ